MPDFPAITPEDLEKYCPVRKLTPKVYVNINYSTCTTGCIVTREGAVLIDTPLIPQQARHWRSQIEGFSRNTPIAYILLTDHHRGHALGCQHFMPALVIGHERAHKEMQGFSENFKERVRNSFRKMPEIQAEMEEITVHPPQITYTQRAGFFIGGTSIECIFVGGHTPATSIIWLEKERICFVGDTIWTDQHPYMAQANSEEWLEALKLIRSLDPAVIVPGHGQPLEGLDRIRLMEDYIQSLRQQVAECLAAGKDKNETKKELVKELMDRFTVPNARKSKIESQIGSGINRVYRELQRAAQVPA